MAWKRSSRCDAGNCVEVDLDDDTNVFVCNSENPEDYVTFTKEEWDAFVKGVQAGEFNV